MKFLLELDVMSYWIKDTFHVLATSLNQFEVLNTDIQGIRTGVRLPDNGRRLTGLTWNSSWRPDRLSKVLKWWISVHTSI